MEGLGFLAMPEVDAKLEKALRVFASQTAFTISSCRTPDMPIVFASPGFIELTGYSCAEVLGRNCRFLQGPGTSRQAVLELRNCIQEDRGCTVCLLNYRKDGRPFWNQLCLAPVADEHGVAFYLGIQSNVTGVVLAHRSRQFSSSLTSVPGPHGGVHSFKGCPDVVNLELQRAAELGKTIKHWHSENSKGRSASHSKGPVSCATLPTSLLTPLYKLQQSFVLVDPTLPDMPIVHASEAFITLTGRPRSGVVGHNCRFMQGPKTDQAEVARLREAIAEQRPITVKVLNYRYNGSPFWNSLHVAPIRNADGQVVFFVGVQLDITLADSKGATGQETSAMQAQPSDLQTGRGVPGGSTPGAESRSEAEDLPEADPMISPCAKHNQRSVVGAVRVVCRSLSAKSGLRRSLEDQHDVQGNDCNNSVTRVQIPSDTVLTNTSSLNSA